MNIKISEIKKNLNKLSFFIFLVSFVLALISYYFAISLSIKLEDFIRYNPPHIVFLQIGLSLINALLIAIALMLGFEVLRKKKNLENLNVFQAGISLFFSVISTGCYICGTILPAAIGIAAPFATLPLGGIEVKILTIPMLLYSIRQFSLSLNNECKIRLYKNYKFIISDSITFSVNFKLFDRLKPLFISIFFIGLIYLLPVVLGNKINAKDFPKICIHTKYSATISKN